jgi:hypothetical protein
MKNALFIFMLAFIFINTGAYADAKNYEHLLDGSSMKYYYQSGSGVQMEFYDGKLKYEWITGPRKGKGNHDLSYQSRKIGHKMYLVSWLEESHPDYITLVFNFDNNTIFSSGIARFGSENQLIVFDGGIVENLVLIEN